MLGELPIKGDRHGFGGVMHVFLVLPTPCTFTTRIGGLLMERRGWSRKNAIVFDVAGILLFLISAYLYREFGNVYQEVPLQ